MFFKVEKNHNTAPDFEIALKTVFASGSKASEREKEVLGQILRLERLDRDNTFFAGEIVRKQTGDIPPEANDNGLQRLSVSEGGGIGHCIAFRYSVAVQGIAIQFDNRMVSVNRLLAYIKEFDPTYDYRADPMVRQDAWVKYNTGLPTKFTVEVAQPQNLPEIEGEVGSVIQSAQNLAEMAQSPVLLIETKMGRRKGSLSKSLIDGLLGYFTSGQGGTEDIRKLSVTSSNEDGSEAINFLKEFLKENRSVEVPEGDPDTHFQNRQKWIETCFKMHIDYIKKVYGATDLV
jgi:hypothetical protein